MVGLLIFILSRHRAISLWRFVPQVALETGWVWKHWCLRSRIHRGIPFKKISPPVCPRSVSWMLGIETARRALSCNSPMQTQQIGRITFSLTKSAVTSGLSRYCPLVYVYYWLVPTQETRIKQYKFISPWQSAQPRTQSLSFLSCSRKSSCVLQLLSLK